MPVLQALQAELGLAFPLLRDDRDFLAQYGVQAAGEDETPAPAMFLINRQQVIAWVGNPVSSVESALAEIEPLIKAEGTPTANYPKAGHQPTGRSLGELISCWLAADQFRCFLAPRTALAPWTARPRLDSLTPHH